MPKPSERIKELLQKDAADYWVSHETGCDSPEEMLNRAPPSVHWWLFTSAIMRYLDEEAEKKS